MNKSLIPSTKISQIRRQYLRLPLFDPLYHSSIRPFDTFCSMNKSLIPSTSISQIQALPSSTHLVILDPITALFSIHPIAISSSMKPRFLPYSALPFSNAPTSSHTFCAFRTRSWNYLVSSFLHPIPVIDSVNVRSCYNYVSHL